MSGLPTYPDCPIQRELPSITINKEIAERFGKEYDILPLFEKFLFEYKYRQYYSLQTNKLLQCRWRSYVEHYDERDFVPFTFVDIRFMKKNCLNKKKVKVCDCIALKCSSYIQRISIFVDVDFQDFHFYSGMNRLLPEKSIHRIKQFPYKLGVGPGVDFRGQMPIPQDMMMKRGLVKPRLHQAKGKIYHKTTNESQNEIKDKK